MYRNWFLDFDDTLVTGPTTWGLTHALPKLVREHNLPMDPQRYHAAVLVAQERVNKEPALQPILDDLFDGQGWPRTLQAALMDDMRNNYRPALFPDTLPFLNRLRETGMRAFLLSNNPTAPDIAKMLGIESEFVRCFTPRLCPGSQPKPHISLWYAVLAAGLDVRAEESVIIGDDPWSEAAFADACGVDYWIVDRMERFRSVASVASARCVVSLLDIPTEAL